MLPPIHFSHANGFPALTYTYLFELLRPYPIKYINAIGLQESDKHYQYQPTLHWDSLRDELISFLQNNYSEPIIGIGHSLGGVVTFMAAVARPDLFRKIILLDPPMFSPKKRVLMAIAYHLGITQYFEPASKAIKRRTHFDSLEEAALYFGQKPLFKNFHPKTFAAYIAHALSPTPHPNGNYTLSIPAALEYRIFSTTPYRLPAQKPNVKTYFLYADKSNVLDKNDIAWLKTRYNFDKIMPIEGGHLFPLEQPQYTAELIKQLIHS